MEDLIITGIKDIKMYTPEGKEITEFPDILSKKVVRPHKYAPTRISGMHKDYQKLYNELIQWDRLDESDTSSVKHLIYTMGYDIGEAAWFGWGGEPLRHEKELFAEIESTYRKLLHTIEDALGIDSEVYESELDNDGNYKY